MWLLAYIVSSGSDIGHLRLAIFRMKVQSIGIISVVSFVVQIRVGRDRASESLGSAEACKYIAQFRNSKDEHSQPTAAGIVNWFAWYAIGPSKNIP